MSLAMPAAVVGGHDVGRGDIAVQKVLAVDVGKGREDVLGDLPQLVQRAVDPHGVEALALDVLLHQVRRRLVDLDVVDATTAVMVELVRPPDTPLGVPQAPPA